MRCRAECVWHLQSLVSCATLGRVLCRGVALGGATWNSRS